MSFHDYRAYSSTQLETIFQVKIVADGNIFEGFTRSGREYTELQKRVDSMESRISISADAGE